MFPSLAGRGEAPSRRVRDPADSALNRGAIRGPAPLAWRTPAAPHSDRNRVLADRARSRFDGRLSALADTAPKKARKKRVERPAAPWQAECLAPSRFLLTGDRSSYGLSSYSGRRTARWDRPSAAEPLLAPAPFVRSQVPFAGTRRLVSSNPAPLRAGARRRRSSTAGGVFSHSRYAQLKRLLRIDQNGDGTVVHQLHVHVRAEHTVSDAQSAAPQERSHSLVQGLGRIFASRRDK